MANFAVTCAQNGRASALGGVNAMEPRFRAPGQGRLAGSVMSRVQCDRGGPRLAATRPPHTAGRGGVRRGWRYGVQWACRDAGGLASVGRGVARARVVLGEPPLHMKDSGLGFPATDPDPDPPPPPLSWRLSTPQQPGRSALNRTPAGPSPPLSPCPAASPRRHHGQVRGPDRHRRRGGGLSAEGGGRVFPFVLPRAGVCMCCLVLLLLLGRPGSRHAAGPALCFVLPWR